MSELKEITHDSMKNFISTNLSFCSALKATLLQWGQDGDHDAINHFQNYVTIVMTEAIERYQQHHEAKSWKNYNA